MRKLYGLFAAIAFLCFSCNQFQELEDLEGVKYDAEYAVPIIDTRLSLEDLLEGFEENATLVVNNDGSLSFIYQDTVITQTSDDIFNSINASLPPVIPISGPNVALPFSSPDGLQIDRLDLKGGTLSYYLENKNNESVAIKITFPQVTKNGVPLTYQLSLPAYSGTGSAPIATNIVAPTDLSGYKIETVNDSIYLNYEAVTPSGNKVNLSNFFIRLQNLSFLYAEGYFGNFLYEGTRDTLDIDFFDNWIRGDVYFENPRITLNVENSFGIPTRARVNALNVLTVKNQVLQLESPYVTNGIDFPYPALNEVGQVKTGSFSFTKENSNIDVILGEGPVAIDYDVDAVTNPDNNPGIRGFIAENSYYKASLEVELPLYGRASGFVVQDTLDLDFSSYEDVDKVEFKLVVDNGTPLDVAIQGYFLNESGGIIDSLLAAPQTLIQGAPVNADGVATGTQQKITFIPFDGERFTRIQRRGKRLWISAAFSTLNNGATSVRVINTQDVRIRMGAKLGVSE